MRILAIETSCDETAAAVVEAHGNTRPRFLVHSNVIASQIKVHRTFGGVVPTLAAREHTKNLTPVTRRALREARISLSRIDMLAVTQGPGLIPTLLIGTYFARMVSYLSGIPIVGVNHMEGHMYANFLHNKPVRFPVLALIVSGGHTQLVMMRRHLTYELLGETRDDAAGEAFDKVARLLNLPYPGGPEIARRAEGGNAKAYAFPRPMMHAQNFDFSFSGLKTAVRYALEGKRLNKKTVADVCASVEQAIVEVLIEKTLRALSLYQPKTVFLTGGVAANRLLRHTLAERIQEFSPRTEFYAPPVGTSTDNAAMIAAAAYMQHTRLRPPSGEVRVRGTASWKHVTPRANLPLVH